MPWKPRNLGREGSEKAELPRGMSWSEPPGVYVRAVYL